MGRGLSLMKEDKVSEILHLPQQGLTDVLVGGLMRVNQDS